MQICSVEGCGRTHSAKGLCRRHYYQQKNGWSPLPTLGMDLSTRIAHYTQQTGECCEWGGAKNKAGYGMVSVGNKRQLVTRTLWAELYGEIPEGTHVLHSCDNPACIRPSHLFLGTHKDNMDDRGAKGRCVRGRTHHFAKLTATQFEEIKMAVGTQRAIAARYGVTQATVSNIKRGKVTQ